MRYQLIKGAETSIPHISLYIPFIPAWLQNQFRSGHTSILLGIISTFIRLSLQKDQCYKFFYSNVGLLWRDHSLLCTPGVTSPDIIGTLWPPEKRSMNGLTFDQRWIVKWSLIFIQSVYERYYYCMCASWCAIHLFNILRARAHPISD